MTTNQAERVPDEELDQMIWKLERDGMTPKMLSLMKEVREMRRAKGQRAPVVGVIDETLIDGLRFVQCMLDDYRESNYGHAMDWVRHINTKMEEYSDKHGDDAYCVMRETMQLSGNSEQLEPVSNRDELPDGYCAMPLKLTAENGAKGALSGEFHVSHRIVCQSCGGEGCEDCNDEGGWDGEIPIGWDTIKLIHQAAVEACALPAVPQEQDAMTNKSEQVLDMVNPPVTPDGWIPVSEHSMLPPLKYLDIVKFNADCAIQDPESIYANEFFLSLDEVFGEIGNYSEPVQAKAVSTLIAEVFRLSGYSPAAPKEVG